LPSETRSHTVSGDKSVNTGMVMAVSIFYSGTNLTVIAGYESGHTMVTQQTDREGWHILYMSKPHSQPILSLAVDNKISSYIASSADAIIAKHPIPTMSNADTPATQTEPYSLADSAISSASGSSLLSMSLTSSTSTSRGARPRKIEIQTTPMKMVQTKHSGQQSLKIRSDGKIFATAGWDSRVRVYSVQNLKELAVLKWHKEGCYAVAFADVNIHDGAGEEKGEDEASNEETRAASLIPSAKTLTVKGKRDLKAIMTHWLAAGSKDGKVSLWDIY
jgi:ASTRA-associated protein 1